MRHTEATIYRWHAASQGWQFDSAVAHGREAFAPLPPATRGDPQGRAALPPSPISCCVSHSLSHSERIFL